MYRCTFPVGSAEYLAAIRAINQGIDARLEGFVASTFGWQAYPTRRLLCAFEDSELPIFIRRLADSGDPEAEELADCIVYSAYGVEVAP